MKPPLRSQKAGAVTARSGSLERMVRPRCSRLAVLPPRLQVRQIPTQFTDLIMLFVEDFHDLLQRGFKLAGALRRKLTDEFCELLDGLALHRRLV